MARLGDICTIYTGTGFPNQYQGETSGDYPFYKVGDISKNVTKGNKYLQECDNYVSADIVKKIKGTIVPIDTVVFAKIGEAVKLNKRAITSKNCLVDNNAIGVCPDQKRLNLSYFFHYMCNIQLETYAEATTVPSVKKSSIENLDIPLPTYEEQTKKSLILDKVCDLISLRKQQLSKLDELVKSRFIELIHNNNIRYVKLKDVAEDGRIITYGIVKPGEHTEGGVPIIKVKDFPNGTILMSDMLLASPEIESKYERSRVKEGDLLFSIRGSVGRTAFVPKELIDANITQDTARISVGTDFNPQYIRAALGFDSVQQEINEHVRGVAVRGISLAELRDIGIPVVEKKTQDEFGRFVEQTDKSKFEIQKSLEKLETLKKALMQKYFG